MTDQINKLSPAMKDLLTFLKWDPAAFQAQAQNLKSGKKINKNDPFYTALGRKDTIAEIAARVQAAKPRVWLPLGYVMFLRKNLCKGCGASEAALDCPSVYLMQTDKIGSATRRITPVTSIEYKTLPHWFKESKTESLYCPLCFPIAGAAVGTTLSPSSPVANLEHVPCVTE